eukprot:scaffold571_cov225-Isochrysis_galbana.AAC.1
MFVIRSISGNVKSVWWSQINLAKFAKFWKKRSCGPNQPRKFLVVRNRPVTSCVAQRSGAAGVAVLHVWSAVFCEPTLPPWELCEVFSVLWGRDFRRNPFVPPLVLRH